MQGDEGEVIVHKVDSACFSRLLADGEAFLVSLPGMVIIATVTRYFPHDVERLRNPRLMRKFAEQCQAFLNEGHGRRAITQHRVAQKKERPGHLEPIPIVV